MMAEAAKTLLIVDDIEGVRRELGLLLEDEGYIALTAANGHLALKMLAGSRIDLVVTDILMPEMDGIELISGIKELDPHMPIIAITGGGELARRGAGIDLLKIAEGLGANYVLRKPFECEAFLEVIDTALAAG